ncbi:MAG TPA: hypothetical protein VJW77_04280 [Terriglobia bacterium]|nr:hypothetical protein [Terriglobia bacterium]
MRRLREQYPRWGKDKLTVLLRREGWAVSVSMVRRILTSLRQRGVLNEPMRFRVNEDVVPNIVPGRCATPRITRWRSRVT